MWCQHCFILNLFACHFSMQQGLFPARTILYYELISSPRLVPEGGHFPWWANCDMGVGRKEWKVQPTQWRGESRAPWPKRCMGCVFMQKKGWPGWKACNEDLDTVWYFPLSLDTTAYYSESLTQVQSLHPTKSVSLKPEATMDPLPTNRSKRFIGFERQPPYTALDLCISSTHNKLKMTWYRLVS